MANDQLSSRWEDLNLNSYRRLCAETIRMLPPKGIGAIMSGSLVEDRFCIFRHDIDMSPEAALDLARVEHELGVKATYCVLLTGPFYNAFEDNSRKVFQEICSLGHDMALHFDAAWHGISDARSLGDALEWETRMLSNLLGGYQVTSFAFHNTTAFTLSCRDRSYGGLLNFYSSALLENVTYVSDSNGFWRFGSWESVIEERPQRLQVLTHPEWWTSYCASPAEKVCRHLAARERRTWNDYVNLLHSAGRENLSPVPDALASLGEGGDWERSVLQKWLRGDRQGACREVEARLSNDTASHDLDEASRFEDLAARLNLRERPR